MQISAKLYMENNDVFPCEVSQKELSDGVVAVYADAKSESFLDASNAVKINFKTDIKSCRYTAVYRHSEYWCRPFFGNSFSDIPDETQVLIAELDKDNFIVVLPVVSEFYRCVVCSGDENESIGARLFSQVGNLKECKALAVVYKIGKNPYELIKDCVKAALSELGTGVLMRDEREYPEVFEYLGWCSWDALQIRVSEDGLLEKCREFKEKNIPVRWAIVDDMWANVPKFRKETYSSREEMFKLMHTSALADFEADPVRFPNGLCHAVGEMKKYLTWVGIWHPTTGYWFGIEPESNLYKELENDLYKTEDGRFIIKPEYDSFYKFFNSWHTFFEKCGADFVKIDNQSIIRRYYKGCAPIGKIARDMHTAMEKSAKAHFGNRLINCMGCASDNIWNRPESPVSRCSDDFQPDNRDWFTKHILQCSYACFMQGEIINCDWDMWWSSDAQGIKNSVIRAVSGGPIYISDEIGQSVREVLMPLVFSDGKILRCDRPALPTLDCLVSNPEEGGIFKIQNVAKKTGVIAAFNINSGDISVSGTVSPDDVEGLCGEKFAVYEHFTKQCFVMSRGERIEVELKDRDDFRLYNFVEIKDGFAAIGDVNKFISPLSVVKADADGVETVEGTECLVYNNGRFETVC